MSAAERESQATEPESAAVPEEAPADREPPAPAPAAQEPERDAAEPLMKTSAAAASEPPPGDDGFERRHPNALWIELGIGGAVVTAITLVALLVATLLVFSRGLTPWLFAAALAVPLFLSLPLLLVPRWQHQRYLYRVDERGLEIRHGVWWRRQRLIPHSRLQHTDVSQGPLERTLGLAKLVVHTAGTHEARTTVAGLSIERARGLRDRLTGAAGASRSATEDGV